MPTNALKKHCTAGLLSELAAFSRGLEARHGADHSVAVKLRVLHRDLSKVGVYLCVSAVRWLLW